jgi:hypothetical protein
MLEQLHRAWLQRLRAEWQALNVKLGGRLKPPVFTIDRAQERLGRWDRQGRILGISEHHIWSHAWEDVLDTLRHETAHQYVTEVLGVMDETPHGPAFAEACRVVGVQAKASGPLQGDRTEVDRILAKVRKLLALAASPNAHEAEAAMAAANTLLLKYNLELTGNEKLSGYGFRRVGGTSAALPVEWKLVASILSAFFFVECIWVNAYDARRNRNVRMLEIVGSDANLELAAYVHDFLHRACDALWRESRRELKVRTAASRRAFVAGVLMGFQEKLKQERRGNEARGLVWLGDPDLKHFFRDRHPSTRSLGGGGVRGGDAHEAGRAAGRELRIHKGVHDVAGRGRLLGKT